MIKTDPFLWRVISTECEPVDVLVSWAETTWQGGFGAVHHESFWLLLVFVVCQFQFQCSSKDEYYKLARWILLVCCMFMNKISTAQIYKSPLTLVRDVFAVCVECLVHMLGFRITAAFMFPLVRACVQVKWRSLTVPPSGHKDKGQRQRRQVPESTWLLHKSICLTTYVNIIHLVKTRHETSQTKSNRPVCIRLGNYFGIPLNTAISHQNIPEVAFWAI